MDTENFPKIEGFESLALVKEREDFTFWTATQLQPKRSVELMTVNDGANPAIVARAFAVYAHVAECPSRYIQRVFAVDSRATRPYVVLERVQGRTLFETIKTGGPFDSVHTLALAKQIGQALSVLNEKRQIAIRNIKPSSIRIDVAGNARLCDFSLAVLPNSREYGVAPDNGAVVGTPQYISPEQAEALPTLDFRTDFYSLGAVLYYACTGIIPFNDPDVYKILERQKTGFLPDPQTIRRGITRSLARLISFLMAKKPEIRYASCEDMLSDIANAEARKRLSLLVPNDFATSVPVFDEPSPVEAAPAKPESGVAAGQKAADHLRKLAGNDASIPSAKASFLHFVLWLLLIVWFVWLGNMRLGNPMGLPAPDPLPDWLYERPPQPPGVVTIARVGANEQPDEFEESGGGQSVVVDAVSKAGVSSVPASDRTSKAQPSQQQPSQEQKEQADKAAAFSEAANHVEPELSTWAPAVIEKVKEGNYAAARKLAAESKSILGGEVAAQLARIPDLNRTVVEAIMEKEGRDVTLTYMGKERELVPMSAEGNVITTSFNGRTVKVDVAQLSDAEKLKWLGSARGDAAHILGASLALRVGDEEALATHLTSSGAFRKLFGK